MRISKQRKKEIIRNRILFVVGVLLVIALVIGGIVWLMQNKDNGQTTPPDTTSSTSESDTSSLPPQDESSTSQSGTSQSASEVSSSQSSSQDKSQPEAIDYDKAWSLLLVNKKYPLEAEHKTDLAEVQGYSVDARIADSLKQMIADAKAAGHKLTVISGHRTFARSKSLYENKTAEYVNLGYNKEDAAVEAAKWVAPPGTSEHNTGLAVDIVSSDYYTKLPDLLPEFEDFDEAKWLKANCAKYGFILRFPKGKEDITQVNYEPWHFRYVGVEHAKKIMEQDITLEEYLNKA